jgi:hypothetical protein
MTTNRLFFAVIASVSLSAAQGASLPNTRVAPPTAAIRITDANYCFARVRRLSPERQPPSYLVLRLQMQVAYRNPGTRPLIMPLEHERTIYTALKPGVMNIFHELYGFVELDPTLKMMKDLPPKVSPDNPSDPRNDVFAVIPAGGYVLAPLIEEIVLPVNHKQFLRHDPDLRGHRVYLRMQFDQQELSPALETDLSDRWARFGVPWTGNMMTNVVTVDVPQTPPQAQLCVDHQVGTPVQRSDTGK